jgi:thiol:disulfide interchange protein DsbD
VRDVRRGRGLALAAAVAVACVAVAAPAADDVVRARLDVDARRAVVEMTIAPGWHVNAHVPRDDFLIPTTLTLVAPAGVRVGDVEYPAPVERRLAFGGSKTFLLYEGTVRLTASLDGTPEPGGRFSGALRYQACDDSRCLPPRTIDLEVRDAAAPAAGSGAGGAALVAGWVARWGWAATFVWVALLGVALNLTPCVYPLISVTVAFFGGRTASDHRHALRRSLVYVVGICLSFSALGVAAALTGSLFGAALQRPAVIVTIAAVLVGLAGSNFGLWQIRVPYPVMQRLGRIGEGDVGALFMGLTMGVVAAPCIGPVVAALLLFVGARQSVALGFGLFFVLGLGMGAPYVALARVAGRLRALPRAGAWLEWIERLFGFLLLGLALYFVAPVLPDAWVRAATVALLASAGLVLGFLGPETPPAMRWPRRAVGVAVVGLALVAGVPGVREGILGAETDATLAWSAFSDDALGAAIAARKPVLIDFEAEWCIPCREMAHTTFRDPRVVRAAAPFAALKVDLTRDDDRTEALTKRFQVAGVPTYLLLGADGVERRRLAGFQAAPEMIRALEDVAGG